MSCPSREFSDQLLAWLDGALPAEDARLFAAHVAQCPSCQEDLEQLRETTGRVAAAYRVQRERGVPALCPAEEVLVGLAEGTLSGDERARVERHLAICAPCTEQVALLRDFEHASADGAFVVPPMPAAVRRAFEEAAGPAKVVPLVTKRRSAFGLRQLAGLAASVAVLFFVAFLFMTGKMEAPQSVATRQAPGSEVAVEPGMGAGGERRRENAAPSLDEAVTADKKSTVVGDSAVPPAAPAGSTAPPAAVAPAVVAPTVAGGRPALPATPLTAPASPARAAEPAIARADEGTMNQPGLAGQPGARPAAKAPGSGPVVGVPEARPAAKQAPKTEERAPAPPPAVAKGPDAGPVTQAMPKPADDRRVAKSAPPVVPNVAAAPRPSQPGPQIARVPQSPYYGDRRPSLGTPPPVRRDEETYRKDTVLTQAPPMPKATLLPPPVASQPAGGAGAPVSTTSTTADKDGRPADSTRVASGDRPATGTLSPAGAPAANAASPPASAPAPSQTVPTPGEVARQENDSAVLRGSSGADESGLRARGRAAAATVLGTQDFTLRVTVTSAGIRRVDVVLSSAATPAVQGRLRAELTRVLELNASRGDSVTIYAP